LDGPTPGSRPEKAKKRGFLRRVKVPRRGREREGKGGVKIGTGERAVGCGRDLRTAQMGETTLRNSKKQKNKR